MSDFHHKPNYLAAQLLADEPNNYFGIIETSVHRSGYRWWQVIPRLRSWWYWRKWRVAPGECGGRFSYIDPKALDKFRLQDRI